MQKKLFWQLTEPLDAVIFDCDSTLSQIEGINYLAKNNGVESAVRELTEKAMSETGITPEIYRKRLDLVRPTSAQVNGVAAAYYEHLSPHVDEVIAVLQSFKKKVFVVSAGIQSAVSGFAQRLHIPPTDVFAVTVYFDSQGNYQAYDTQSPMANLGGKREVAEQIKIKYPRLGFLGDWMNDIEAASTVTRFIGYGGVCFRTHIAALCHFYIKTKSFAAVLPLCLTKAESLQLSSAQKEIYELGLAQISQHEVLMKHV